MPSHSITPRPEYGPRECQILSDPTAAASRAKNSLGTLAGLLVTLNRRMGRPFRCTLPATDVHPDNHPVGASCLY